MAKAQAAARKGAKGGKPTSKAPPDDALKRDLIAVGLATLGALLLASLLYHGDGMGVLPAKLSLGMRMTVGLGAYVVPLAIFLLAVFYGLETRPLADRRVLSGTGLILLSVLVLLQVRNTPEWTTVFDDAYRIQTGGGYVGAGIAWVLLRLMGQPGAYIVVVGLAAVGIVLVTRATARELLERFGGTIINGTGYVHGQVKERVRRPVPEPPAPRAPRQRAPRRPAGDAPTDRSRVDLDDPPEGPGAGQPMVTPEPLAIPVTVLSPPGAEALAAGGQAASDDLPVPSPRRRRASGGGRTRVDPAQQPQLLRNSDLFTLPSAAMLTPYPEDTESDAMREEAAEQIIKLEDTLDSFGIAAKVTHYERGPVLTRYEIEPERGIRVNQVTRLADDLALALAAIDVRVEAPIPGKSAIGIEVPNPTRATVSLRGVLESEEWVSHAAPLAFALGRDIAGKPVIPDLGAMPHLLVAGATGTGKSVCLHSIITSLLMRATPDDLRMMMIDPKRVELAVYDGIPHLMAPVVYSVKQAADVLRKAIREMEKRYDKFAVKGVVNLAEFNELARMPKIHATDEFDPLPHVVIIIDELADLMMQSRAEFEYSICRIAQLARATGIHLVLATQRPSVKVVTGNIKANVPSRIALAVASQPDSRTILDGMGAERLIGRGDMLYSPIDANKPRRVQGAFVSRQDIERVVEHLRSQGDPNFDIIPEVPEDEDDFGGEMEASDELFAAAVQYVVQEQEASVSMIQRRFKVGYARAGRLIDMMEQRGVVGPHEGSRPRQVFVQPGMADSVIPNRNAIRELEEAEARADWVNEDANVEDEYVIDDETGDD